MLIHNIVAVVLTGIVAAQEVPTLRTFFYAGGEYADDGTGEHIYRNQIYVERLEPVQKNRIQRYPIVMIHGQAQTGTNFLNKPGGSTSWASRFLSQGYTIYIIDQTFRGRSAWQPGADAPLPTTYSAQLVQQRFTASERYNLWPQAGLHTQWPGEGIMGDEIFDGFYASNVQFTNNASYQQAAVQKAGAALLDRIGKPVILLAHSQGGLMAPLIADARSNLTKAMILLEPSGPPFQEAVFSTGSVRRWGLTDVPLTYAPAVSNPEMELVKEVRQPIASSADNATVPCILQAEFPPPRQLSNLAPLPILVLTSESSYHAPYDYCTVDYYRQAGCSRLDFFELAKLGIRGNGHFLFLENNSDEIWDRVNAWLKKTVV